VIYNLFNCILISAFFVFQKYGIVFSVPGSNHQRHPEVPERIGSVNLTAKHIMLETKPLTVKTNVFVWNDYTINYQAIKGKWFQKVLNFSTRLM
jgi:hypothetical protein